MKKIKQLIDIPDDDGIHIRYAGAKREPYVYRYLRHYRDENGIPRHDAIILGKQDIETGKMFPNKNYFDFYCVDYEYADKQIYEYGYSYLIDKVSKDMGLTDCLSKTFGDSVANNLIIMAAYMIKEGSAMNKLLDWSTKQYFENPHCLFTSQAVSRIFSAITYEDRLAFFEAWIEMKLTSKNVCYDVTSFSSYSENLPSVSRGYNRDNDDLPQFNLGMFCTEEDMVPLYYNRYDGSITDKTNLKYVIKNAEAVGIFEPKLVLDCGFWSAESLSALNLFCKNFVIGMPFSLKESKKIFSELSPKIEINANRSHLHKSVYFKEKEITINGIQGKAILYYNVDRWFDQRKKLIAKVDRFYEELSLIKKYTTVDLKRYSNYIIITKNEHDSGFEYKQNDEKIDELVQEKGYFIIFTTDLNESAPRILDHYIGKDADEKLFQEIKDHISITRFKTHNEETTNGKMFVTFIACIIRKYIERKLNKYLSLKSISLDEAFMKLSNISLVTGLHMNRLQKALTKEQREILEVFNDNGAITNTL